MFAGRKGRWGPLPVPSKNGDEVLKNGQDNLAADKEFIVRPIGVIRTPFQTRAEAPPQPDPESKAEGTIEIYPEYREGLEGLENYSRIVLIFFFDRIKDHPLKVVPRRRKKERGVFATRSPARPAPIGLSVVRLIGIEDGVLRFKGPDMLDGTPLLDIKPVIS